MQQDTNQYQAYPGLFKETMNAVQQNVTALSMTVSYGKMGEEIPVEQIGDQWYLALPIGVNSSPIYFCWRKVMDVTFAVIGILILLLILPVLALLISLDSTGPIFYSQERLGIRGKPFLVYKFRSMRTGAENDGRAIWAAEHDPRVTRVGRFMRSTHLDELPQVFNIIRGDMSLIGPRPEREEFAAKLEKTIPFFRCRLAIKPGLTGWAQVKYRYANSDHDALIKLQHDLYYIKRQSFLLDIFILLKTIIEVLFHRGT